MVPNPSATGNFIDRSLRLALSLGQRPPARHEDAREDSRRDGQHQRHGHPRAVAERHQHQPAQSDVRDLAGGRARRAARSDRNRQLGFRRQLDVAADDDQCRRAADQDLKLGRFAGPGQHRSTEHPVAQSAESQHHDHRRHERARIDEAHQRRQIRRRCRRIRIRPRPGATAIKIQQCAYTKAAYLLNSYPSPAAVNPDLDPNIVGPSGIFTTAEYQSNSRFPEDRRRHEAGHRRRCRRRHHRDGRLRLPHRRPRHRRDARFQPRQLHRRGAWNTRRAWASRS